MEDRLKERCWRQGRLEHAQQGSDRGQVAHGSIGGSGGACGERGGRYDAADTLGKNGGQSARRRLRVGHGIDAAGVQEGWRHHPRRLCNAQVLHLCVLMPESADGHAADDEAARRWRLSRVQR
jgi:hypothetical protein